jgi:nitrogen-specific signal transduction histidine kinase
MGLSIVSGIMKEAEGTFGFTSSDSETVFEGFIPGAPAYVNQK